MYKLIDILFFGEQLDSFHIFHIENDEVEMEKIRCEVIIKNPTTRPGAVQRTLIGVENHCEQACIEKINAIIDEWNAKNVKGFYFIVKRKRQAFQIARKMHQFWPDGAEIYGVDPDYYYSLVPLTGKNKKNIEAYILNLKVDFTIRGRVKHIIKKILITTGLSGLLYEKFIVTVKHVAESSNLTAGLNRDDRKAMGH